MKKSLRILMLGMMLVLIVAGVYLISAVTYEQEVRVTILSGDIAYVVRSERSIDPIIVDVFNEKGLKYNIILDKDIKKTDFSDYRLIFISDDRLRNSKYIPVDKYPSVIINPYYGKNFDLLTRGSISKISSSVKLRVRYDDETVEVYKSPRYKFFGLALPIYYLPDRYEDKNMESIAVPSINSKKKFGDVIAYSNQGPNKCFFGITKTGYWTSDAKLLFEDCVNFALES